MLIYIIHKVIFKLLFEKLKKNYSRRTLIYQLSLYSVNTALSMTFELCMLLNEVRCNNFQ